MVRILCVDLGRDTGGSVYVNASPSDCVLSIKHKLETLTGIPILSQTLYRAATPLTDSTPLHAVADRNPVTNLSLHVPIRGGACRYPTDEPLEFVEQNKAQFLEKLAANRSLEHSIVRRGVNIVTRCGNNMCKLGATHSEVILPKENYTEHLGYCSVRSELLNMNCPVCGNRIPKENFDSFAFVDCLVLVEWRMKDGEDHREELKAMGDTYQILRLTSIAVPYEYIDFTIEFN